MGTVEGCGLLQRDVFQRWNPDEVLSVGRALIELKRLVTDSVALASLDAVTVVIEHLFEGAFVDNRLSPFQAWTLFPLKSLHGDRAKLDAFDRSPGFCLALENADPVETRRLESLQKPVFGPSTRDTAASEFRIFLHFLGHRFVADNV
jgi:hypothetical protein